jgi:hypothetical protein
VNGSRALAASSAYTNHANPSSTISAPTRLSGRRRQANTPVPTKLRPTAGANTAHTALALRWSLTTSSHATPAPASAAATISARAPGLERRLATDEIWTLPEPVCHR